MKKLLHISLVGTSLLIAGLDQANATSTNVLQYINFRLMFLEQGPTNHPTTNVTVATVTTIRVNTKDVIAALGQATTNSFSTAAKLVRLIHINTNDPIATTIEVRDGTNKVDVTSFFAGTFTTNEVRTFRYNSTTHILGGTRYGILHLAVTKPPHYNLTASLRVAGLARTTHTDIVKNQVIIGVEEVEANVAGTGVDTNGVEAIVSGSVSVLGRTTVID